MSRWKFHLIPCRVVSSFRHSECPCLRCTQVMKILSNSMDGFIHCYSGWRSTTMQVLNVSMNTSPSQPCILMRRPKHGLMTMLKVSTVRDGCGPSRCHHRTVWLIHTWIVHSGHYTEVLLCEAHHGWWCIQLLSWTRTICVVDDTWTQLIYV